MPRKINKLYQKVLLYSFCLNSSFCLFLFRVAGATNEVIALKTLLKVILHYSTLITVKKLVASPFLQVMPEIT